MRFHVHMRSMPNVSNFDKDLVLRLKHGMANTTREKLKCDLQLAWLAEGPLDPFPCVTGPNDGTESAALRTNGVPAARNGPSLAVGFASRNEQVGRLRQLPTSTAAPAASRRSRAPTPPPGDFGTDLRDAPWGQREWRFFASPHVSPVARFGWPPVTHSSRPAACRMSLTSRRPINGEPKMAMESAWPA
jgi:hypothetical protein